MEWWNLLMLFFIGAWFLQIILSFFQSRHYQQTLRTMASQELGFLGVGVVKKTLGVGSVVILVTNTDCVVTNAQELSGVTVFGRFRKADRFIGRQLDEIEDWDSEHVSVHAARKAVGLIRQQVSQVDQTIIQGGF
ncbi:glucitol operon activator family protein [Paenibacillus darwinianus]|uniref:Glucitol operon activator family protein n=1 Tax=Paenibacillus darwinianus TaxID=1380763 RepID=A0A9W5S2E0_9BACL|nr:transcriptional regulator GutM [Paenibacillus darwinianus]EXX86920.1 glucitol operon activator family protein [Paenibacillus darwinianus]EXX90661.1 glucitol operon activator family protein [Paenibacillus darwinianus]EXX91625.1 glucitol operon activator family protein [Paenibacillus darwinianus]